MIELSSEIVGLRSNVQELERTVQVLTSGPNGQHNRGPPVNAVSQSQERCNSSIPLTINGASVERLCLECDGAMEVAGVELNIPAAQSQRARILRVSIKVRDTACLIMKLIMLQGS